MDSLVIFLICIGTIGMSVLRSKIGFPSSHSIPPFQAGILYRRGRPVRDVGPGRHRVLMGRERIILIDKRPIQLSFENRAVALADGVMALYGFTASAEVREVKEAIYASATYTQLPGFVTLCVTRAVLNSCQTSQIRIGQVALAEEIITVCRSRLAAAGFELLSFRFTQLVIASAGPYEN